MNAAPGRARSTWRRHWRWLAVALAVCVLLIGVDTTRRVVQARGDLLAAAVGLDATRATLGPLLRFDASAWPDRAGYEAVIVQTAAAEARLRRARGRLGYLRAAARMLHRLPGWGGQAAQAPRAVDLGLDVSVQTLALLRTVEPLFIGSGTSAERVREVMVLRHDRLDAELAALAGAAAEARSLQSVGWSGPFARARPLIDGLVADLDRVHAVRAVAQAAAAGIDPLLGFDGPRTYLVLGQNEQEIRATGGFPGTMGVIVLQNGRLVSSDYRSTYDFDPPSSPAREPPAALRRYMGLSRWYVRDANWDPAFARSAERTLQFFREDRGIDADGVIAVDAPLLRLLLQATGPLTVEGFDEPLTDANFFALLEEEIFSGGDSAERKQRLLQPVLQQVFERVQNVDAEGVPPLIAALREGAGGRDLQIYSRDPRVAALVGRLGVDGALAARPGRDFVAVVDSNVAYVKIQLVIRREITYLRRADGVIDLAVRWTNERSTFAGPRYLRLGEGGQLWDADQARMVPAPGTFGNYARIYLPAGTTLDAITGFTGPPGIERQPGFTVVTGLVAVKDGEARTVVVSYRPGGPGAPPPVGVDVWKQGGQERDTLRVVEATGTTQLVPFDGPLTRDAAVDFRLRR